MISWSCWQVQSRPCSEEITTRRALRAPPLILREADTGQLQVHHGGDLVIMTLEQALTRFQSNQLQERFLAIGEQGVSS